MPKQWQLFCKNNSSLSRTILNQLFLKLAELQLSASSYSPIVKKNVLLTWYLLKLPYFFYLLVNYTLPQFLTVYLQQASIILLHCKWRLGLLIANLSDLFQFAPSLSLSLWNITDYHFLLETFLMLSIHNQISSYFVCLYWFVFLVPLPRHIGTPQSYVLSSLLFSLCKFSCLPLAIPSISLALHFSQAEPNISNCHMDVLLYLIFDILKWNITFSLKYDLPNSVIVILLVSRQT